MIASGEIGDVVKSGVRRRLARGRPRARARKKRVQSASWLGFPTLSCFKNMILVGTGGGGRGGCGCLS